MTDLFFYLSKLFWFLLQPDHALLVLLLVGLFWRGALGRLLVAFSLVSFTLLSIYPLGNHLLRPLEQQFQRVELPADIQGIVILGGGEDAERSVIHGSSEFNHAAERLMVIPMLAQRYPEAKLLFTGGSGSLLRPEYRGGDIAEDWLTQQGYGERLMIERDSRNTFQNAVYSRDLIRDFPEVEGRWLLVTSAFHMPRSMGVFRQQGLELIPYPVDYRSIEDRFRPDLNKNMADLKTAIREWIGLLAYYFTDKTSELLPSPLTDSRLEQE